MMKHKHFIDFHKGITFLYILFLIGCYNAYQNITIWVYLGLHGTYGILWILKSIVFPDKSWEQKSSLIYGLFILSGLSLYWISPWIIVSGYFNGGVMVEVPLWVISLAISLFGMGVFFHFSSDMQKHTSLKLKPGDLIVDGLFSKSRNINYFGELLIYISFAILSMHWIPFMVLFTFILLVWMPNIIKKDKSLSRYENFEDYKNRSNIFWPL